MQIGFYNKADPVIPNDIISTKAKRHEWYVVVACSPFSSPIAKIFFLTFLRGFFFLVLSACWNLFLITNICICKCTWFKLRIKHSEGATSSMEWLKAQMQTSLTLYYTAVVGDRNWSEPDVLFCCINYLETSGLFSCSLRLDILLSTTTESAKSFFFASF